MCVLAQAWRLSLIVRCQVILYRRHGRTVLQPFKYAGYPLLLEALAQWAPPQVLGSRKCGWLGCVSCVGYGVLLADIAHWVHTNVDAWWGRYGVLFIDVCRVRSIDVEYRGRISDFRSDVVGWPSTRVSTFGGVGIRHETHP